MQRALLRVRKKGSKKERWVGGEEREGEDLSSVRHSRLEFLHEKKRYLFIYGVRRVSNRGTEE